jgi:hypothetical protein
MVTDRPVKRLPRYAGLCVQHRKVVGGDDYFADAVDPVSTRSASKPWMVRTRSASGFVALAEQERLQRTQIDLSAAVVRVLPA